MGRTSSKPRVLPGSASSSKSSIYITTSTNHPGFLFPAIKATTSSEQQWITVESQSFSPDQARSHDKQPSSHILPEDEDTMLVTDVHYEGLKSRTAVSGLNDEQLSLPTLLTRGVQDQGKGQVWMTKPNITSVTSAPNAESRTIYVTSNTLSVSVKNANEPTQPLFNGKSENLTNQNTNHGRLNKQKHRIQWFRLVLLNVPKRAHHKKYEM